MRHLPSLIGRDDDLAEVARILTEGAPLVTVIGPPGVGKTTLAAAVLRRFADTDPNRGRSVEVDLAPVTHALDAVETIASEVGVPLRAVDGLEANVRILGGALAHGPTLLCLDNVDHVAAELAPLLEGWIEGAGELGILATSRARIGVSCETVYPLDPLSIPAHADGLEASDAYRLWTVQMARLAPQHRGAAADRSMLAALLRDLDGLPLAIELAAARAAALGVRNVASSPDRLGLLDPLPADTRRLPSLRRALAAVVATLGPEECAALSHLTVFEGAFSFAAACAVVGADAGPPSEVVTRLADRRLLTRVDGDGGAEPTLRLLETIKEYGRTLAEPTGARAASLRHARYHAERIEELAQDLRAEGFQAVAERIFALRREVLAAARRCLEMGTSEGWALAVRSFLGALDTPIRQIDKRSIEQGLRRLLDDGKRVGDPDGCVRTALAIAAMAVYTSDRESREADIARAAGLVAGHPDESFETELLSIRSWARANDGQLDDAHADASRVVDRPLDSGLRSHCRARETLAEVARQRGDVAGARAQVLESFALAKRIGRPCWVVSTCVESAFVEAEANRNDLAQEAVARGLAIVTRLPVQGSWQRIPLLMVSGRSHHAAGALEEARAGYVAAAEEARYFGDTMFEAVSVTFLGLVHLEEGDLGAAREALAYGAPILRTRGILQYAAAAEALLGLADAELRDFDIGRQRAEKARVALEALKHPLSSFAGAVSGAVDALEKRARGDAGATEPALVAARAMGGVPLPLEGRLLVRILERVLSRSCPPPPPVEPLRVDAAMRWIEPPRGKRLACVARPVMRRVLSALLQARNDRPGRPIPPEALVRAAWPGERMRRESGRHRLQVIVLRMRQLGLRDVVLTTDEGYLLDPTLPIDCVQESP